VQVVQVVQVVNHRVAQVLLVVVVCFSLILIAIIVRGYGMVMLGSFLVLRVFATSIIVHALNLHLKERSHTKQHKLYAMEQAEIKIYSNNNKEEKLWKSAIGQKLMMRSPHTHLYLSV
jgi:hypothetical protein